MTGAVTAAAVAVAGVLVPAVGLAGTAVTAMFGVVTGGVGLITAVGSSPSF